MAIKFQTNIPLTLTFPYGDFKEINGQFGQQFLYTVELAGQRDKLFATPLLHQELQAAGVGPGAVLTIAKIEAEGNRKGWVIVPETGLEEEPPTTNGRDAAPARIATQSVAGGPHTSPNGTSNVNGLPADSSPVASAKGEALVKEGHHPSDGPNFSDLQTLMGNCIRASWEAWRSVDDGDFDFRSEDVRGVGITLFLECARKNIVPQAIEEGLPF